MTGFQTASEFYGVDDPETRGRPGDAPNFAKTIVWYDPATPLYVCAECHEHVAPLRFQGDELELGLADDMRVSTMEVL